MTGLSMDNHICWIIIVLQTLLIFGCTVQTLCIPQPPHDVSPIPQERDMPDDIAQTEEQKVYKHTAYNMVQCRKIQHLTDSIKIEIFAIFSIYNVWVIYVHVSMSIYMYILQWATAFWNTTINIANIEGGEISGAYIYSTRQKLVNIIIASVAWNGSENETIELACKTKRNKI